MYIAIEGVDSVGKTTQYKLLQKYFPRAIFTKEPYDRNIINKILNNKKYQSKKSVDNLFINDRIKHENEILRSNIEKKKLIISDRSCVSGYAYSNNKNLDHFKECIKPKFVFILFSNNGNRLYRKDNNDLDNLSNEEVIELQNNMIKFMNMYRIKHEVINCFDKHYNISYNIVYKIVKLCNEYKVCYL